MFKFLKLAMSTGYDVFMVNSNLKAKCVSVAIWGRGGVLVDPYDRDLSILINDGRGPTRVKRQYDKCRGGY